jgi:DnaJ-class molecular chaperone
MKLTTETCTQCGGLGRVPNHPIIPSKRCPRCKGSGKVLYDQPVFEGESNQQKAEEVMKELEVQNG